MTDDAHKLFKYYSAANPKESLDLVQTTDKWEWTLSFNERFTGDYNADLVTNIADLTSLAIYHGSTTGDRWTTGGYDVDRSGDCSGTVDYGDVLPLAITFGKELIGYNVYWQDSTGGNWVEIAELTADTDRTYGSGSGVYRGFWETAFTKVGIYDYTSGQVTVETSSGNDLVSVKPVFSTGEEDIRSETDTFEHVLSSPNSAPVADLSANPTVGSAPLLVAFSASGSTDADSDPLTYRWDFDSGDNDNTWPSTYSVSQTNHTYQIPNSYTATVRVFDPVGNWDTDTVNITVSATSTPTAPVFLDFTVTPNSATLPATIVYTADVREIDGDSISSISFDPDGDGTYEVSFDSSDPEWTASTYGAFVTYEEEYTRDSDCISDYDHVTELTVRAIAVDDDGSSVPMTKSLDLEHAKPVINSISITNKVGESAPGDGDDPVTVTVDASDAVDADGPDEFPTRFIFDWGPGEGTTTESLGDAGFDGEATHYYDDPGVYQITVTCYDDDDDTVMDGDCTGTEQDAHVHAFEYQWPADEDGRIHVWSTPQMKRLEPIDNGFGWSNLGDQSIALAINPASCFPGIVYHGTFTNRGQNDPLEIAKFSEKASDAYGWSSPEMVWTGSEKGECGGYQCDLEYHPTIQYPTYQFPHVAQYYYNNSANYTGAAGPGIKLYTKMNGTWTCDVLTDNVYVDSASPIRLVVNNMGSYVQYVGRDVLYRPILTEIDYEGTLSLVTVETFGSGTGVGMSHDLKEYQDDFSGTQNTRASFYTTDSASDDDAKYEVWTGSNWLGTNPALNTDNVNTGKTRHMAIDFLGDTSIGAVWLAGDSDLKWAEYTSSWSTEADLDSGVDNWCDFDYEPITGVPCVAYEKDGEIDFQAYYDGDWQGPMTVTSLVPYQVSHLDMATSDGYVYIAYSNSGRIYCAVIDFCNR